jgi:hypothetical protein
MKRRVLCGLFLAVLSTGCRETLPGRTMVPSLKANSGFRPGEVWNDDAGKPIQAHGGGILRANGTWYWYGEDKSPDDWKGTGAGRVSWVRCYSSPDLHTWHDEGTMLKAVPDPGHDLAPGRVVERPKVLYNAGTGKYVMWMHIDSPDYKYARAGVAVADSPLGPFRYRGSVRPDESESRDMAAWQDDDGTAYLIHSSEGNATLHISLLSGDYLEPSGRFIRIFDGRYREAPAVFKHGGKYYMISSHCTGWKPNEAECAVADSMMGEWQVMGNPCAGDEEQRKLTFHSQSTFVLPLPGLPGEFIFMADRWNARDLPDSRYVWLPLTVRNGMVVIRWLDSWFPAFPPKGT